MDTISRDADSTNATDMSGKFYIHFKERKKDIENHLERFKGSTPPSGTGSPDFSSISLEILALRKDLIDATPYLPSYDRGKCEQQLKGLEEALSQQRAPKSKFSFKRKPPTPATAPGPASRMETKSHNAEPAVNLTTSAAPTSTLTLSSKSQRYLTLASLLSPASSSDPSALRGPELPPMSDVTLRDLHECIVNFFPSILPEESGIKLSITALYAQNLSRVALLIPPIEGSVLLYGINDSVIIVGCHQFRIHDTTNTIVLSHVHSNPIIERSHNVRFGPYPKSLRNGMPEEFFERASKHQLVQDFDWIKATPSPNWTSLEEGPSIPENVVQLLNSGRVEDGEISKLLSAILPQ
ncbi:hypothetical protein M422DRAFT_28815 [Sphaerobolus stellatus SS14]|nr:hypothetical protein M422DRAFT_28815 [Sphaerobolus stellatus SS14]